MFFPRPLSYRQLAVTFAAAFLFCLTPTKEAFGSNGQAVPDVLPAWSKGLLDIYLINTGRGDSAFFIFPDGTTMLFDAGDLDAKEFTVRAAPLKVAPQRPSESVTPGTAIANFIKKVSPAGGRAHIDYAVISHFHGDHYGTVRSGLLKSEKGPYVLTGITEVGDLIPTITLIDRGFPDYMSPTDLRKYHGSTFENYLKFLNFQKTAHGMKIEKLRASRADQICLKINKTDYPSFMVRNIKSGETLWTGKGDQTVDLFDPKVMFDDKGKFTENPLSLAITVSYGNFDYFTGGDMTGLRGPGIPEWFDVETLTAAVLGEVDVLALNHHGNRDATNENFLRALRPRVLVQQAWTSDHPGGEVLHRMISHDIWPGDRDIFSTNMAEETKIALGPDLTRNYTSFEGHIVIRVLPGGIEYFVYVLDDADFHLHVKSMSGPYVARSN